MAHHYPDLGSASDWSCRMGTLLQSIRSTTQIWVVMRHQYGISVGTLFAGKAPLASRNVICFLKLVAGVLFKPFQSFFFFFRGEEVGGGGKGGSP